MADIDDQADGGFRWLNEYEKTWEAIQDDDDGSLQASIDDIVHRAKRKRLLIRKGNIRLGMMRHLYLVIDMSKSMKESDLLRPNKLACLNKLLEEFIFEYFDQNPISQLGVISTKDKRAIKLTDLSGNPRTHISAIREASTKGPEGEPSIQNSLQMALSNLRHLASHATREVLFLYGGLTTCDPGDINDTIKELKENNITCSFIGMSAEMKVCKTITQETKGVYHVILDEKHLKDLLLEHVRPQETNMKMEASLIRMGFPKHSSMNSLSHCLCHISSEKPPDVNFKGYFCPQCQSKYCELPIECKVCGLTLVSAPHIARSYQHLFPLPAFNELSHVGNNRSYCEGCQKIFGDQTVYKCKNCEKIFCNDCDLFIHEILHTCPGCLSCVKSASRDGID